jgi:hypothetical protein
MKDTIHIYSTAVQGSYTATVYDEEGNVKDTYNNNDLRILSAVAKKLKNIYKSQSIRVDLDVLDDILEKRYSV